MKIKYTTEIIYLLVVILLATIDIHERKQSCKCSTQGNGYFWTSSL